MKSGTCPGCQKTKQLVSNHLVSSAVYDYLRTDQLYRYLNIRSKLKLSFAFEE
jgi:hypothetical protein